MPKGKHLPGVGERGQRQYAHVKASELKAGKPLAEAKSIAAAVVNGGPLGPKKAKKKKP